MKFCTWGDISSSLQGKPSGGGELQIALLSKALAKLGNEVVVIDYLTDKDYVTEEGIKVLKIENYNKGIRGLRFFTHRLPGIYDSLVAQKADIYYVQIRDFRHILALWAARKTKGKFIIQLASDLDAMNLWKRIKYDYFTHFEDLYWFAKFFFIELIFPKLIRKADCVLVQHQGQKDNLDKIGIDSIIFYNLIEPEIIPDQTECDRKDFCYVGALDNRKGFADFFKLVEKAQFTTFKVIGLPRDKTGHKYYEKMKSFSNVILLGKLSHKETLIQIRDSKALISTSPMEGFPNIFVEAWACGTPVLSLYFDPGGILRKEGLGEVADGNMDRMLELMKNINTNNDFINKSRSYVERNHCLNDQKMKEIDKLFNSFIQKEV